MSKGDKSSPLTIHVLNIVICKFCFDTINSKAISYAYQLLAW